MIEAITCNLVHAFGFAATEHSARPRFSEAVEAEGPIPVNVRIRSHKGVVPTDMTPASALSSRCPSAVGTLLDCYL
jgi:hypothetical protein